MVGLLALAHASELRGRPGRTRLEQLLAADELPDPDHLRQHFLPAPQELPQVSVHAGSLADYDLLLDHPALAGGSQAGAA